MNTPVPLELQSKIASWRQRAAEGTLTLDEMREAVVHLRAGRLSAASAVNAARKSSAKRSVAPGAEDMLGELGEM
jgi:hypothetical protein